jgi:hypothetical protein
MASVSNAVSTVLQSLTSKKSLRDGALNEEFSLAGVTFNDAQTLLAKVDSRWVASLVREPQNPHDSNAVAVHIKNPRVKDSLWQHVGYIPKKLSPSVASFLDEGQKINITIKRVIGGNGQNYGIVVELQRGN